MTIVINPNIIISAVIIIVALAILLFILRGKDFSFSWKAFYSLIGIAITGFLLYMGNYAIHQAFDSNSVRIVPSDNMPAENSVSVESYKATYDLFSSQFSQLLTFLGFFGTIFGLVIPAGAYLLQRQTLKDEKEGLQKQLERISEKNNFLIRLQQKTQKQVEDMTKRHADLERLQSILFKSTQTAFDGLASIALFHFVNDTDDDKEKKANLFAMLLISFDNAVNCSVMAHNSTGLVKLMKCMRFQIDLFSNSQSSPEFHMAIDKVKSGAEIEAGFVSGEEIQNLLGNDNYELYEWYKELYEPIYHWKFNGQQKKA